MSAIPLPKRPSQGVPCTDPQAVAQVGHRLLEALCHHPGAEVIVLCVGTDRQTGDALGPLVGTQMERQGQCQVIGTLRAPLHARNLLARTTGVGGPGQVVVVVDAAVGPPGQVGEISVRPTGLRPRAGVGAGLPVVGQIAVTGTVTSDPAALGAVRLGAVAEMAAVIASALAGAIARRGSATRMAA